jgi:hypothetical protein
MKFSSSAGDRGITVLGVLGEEAFFEATIAGEALAEFGAE